MFSDINISNTTQNRIEFGLCLIWGIFFLTLVTGDYEAFYNLLIVITPIVIFSVWGVEWLTEYEPRAILFGVFIYFLALSVSELVSSPLPVGLDVLREISVKWILIFVSVLFLFRKEENWSWLMWGIAGSLLITLLISYYNLFTPDAMNLTKHGAQYNFEDALSILGYHKNKFGVYLSFIIPLVSGYTCYLIYYKRYFSVETVCMFLIVLFSLPIVVLTKSRSTHVAAPVAVIFPIVVIMLKRRQFLTLLVSVLCLSSLVAGSLFMTQKGRKIVNEWQERSIWKLAGRTNKIWPAYYKKALKKPWFGYGIRENLYPEEHGHEHSKYVYHLTRTGLVGLTGFILFILLAVFTVLRRLYVEPIHPGTFLILAFAASFLAAILLEGITNHIKWFRLYFITISGLTASACLRKKTSEISPSEENSDEGDVYEGQTSGSSEI